MITRVAPLLYWLLVVCGLVGFSVPRLGSPTLEWYEVGTGITAVWIGTLLGVATGQLLAWLRVRAWLPVLVFVGSVWFLPLGYVGLYLTFGKDVDTAFLAFIPAAVGGYLALSERGALIALWYPTVLWMLAIFDTSAAPDAIERRTALPLFVGLGVLFVAFLRARETRRVALWRTHANAELAPVRSRAVLRESPVRAASEHAFTAVVGVSALLVAAWVAPHLWDVDKDQAPHRARSRTSSSTARVAAAAHPVCCPLGETTKKRERVREYLPLLHDRDREKLPTDRDLCTPCPETAQVATSSSSPYVGYATGGGDVATTTSAGATSETTNAAVVSPATPLASTPAPIITEPPPVIPTPTLLTEPPPHAAPKAATPATPHHYPSSAPIPTEPEASAAAAPTPSALDEELVPTAPTPSGGVPWRWALALSAITLALHALTRAVRRGLVLRHLARPFWPETVDQRISNQWERMLIGLRDAGIRPLPGEQPLAFASRVGIEGMSTCATILERLRHGVRVEADDLDTMRSAASTAYAGARKKAGPAGRALALLRWPLA